MKRPYRILRLIVIGFSGLQPMPSNAQGSEGLRIISEFSENICVSVKQEGIQTSEFFKGKAKAEIGGLLKKLAGAGIEGDYENSQNKYEGLLQSDLASALSDVRGCKERTFTKLLPLLEKISSRQDRVARMIHPGQGKTPVNACTAHATPSDFVIIYGADVAVVKLFPFTVINISNRPIFTLRKHDDGTIGVDLEVAGEDGRLIAKITDNFLEINTNNWGGIKHKGPNHIIVLAQDDTTAIDIEYINSQAVRITGVLTFQGRKIILDKDINTIPGSGQLGGNCSSGFQGAIQLR